jgi:hypothetical protein
MDPSTDYSVNLMADGDEFVRNSEAEDEKVTEELLRDQSRIEDPPNV